MARHHRELFAAGKLLLRREHGQRGRLSAARVRRAISTAYYALFQFVLEECAERIVGKNATLLRRRRILARNFNHAGLRAAFRKIAKGALSSEMASFLGIDDRQDAPEFLSRFAAAFVEAQAQRNTADYDWNKVLTEADAAFFIDEMEFAIDVWEAAKTGGEDDLKDALALLLLLGGKLRGDDA